MWMSPEPGEVSSQIMQELAMVQRAKVCSSCLQHWEGVPGGHEATRNEGSASITRSDEDPPQDGGYRRRACA